MGHQVLARAWRPQTFSDVVGQEAVVRTLQNALSSGTMGHAYLFSGLRGVGKTTVARLLAKAVNCEKGPTSEPCGACLSCQETAAGTSLDLVELDGASNRGIDDVRELRELLRFRPARDRYRVIIIDEVHMLTREAFNALLKSLEEPPPYILFLFATTERHRVPATILSRCQQLELRPVAEGLITAHLGRIAAAEGFELSPAAAAMIARAAQGSIRDALSLLDQLRAFAADRVDEEAVATVLGMPRAERVAALVGALAAGEASEGLRLLREELGAGRDSTVLYQETGRLLRTLLHLLLKAEVAGEVEQEQRQRLEELARSLGADALTRMLGLWVEQEGLLRETVHRELALEVACLRLARWPAVQRLEQLLTGAEPGEAPPIGSGGASGSGPGRRGKPRPQGASGVGARPAETSRRQAAPPAAPVEATPLERLERELRDDPQVNLVRRVLGGEVAAVREDEGGPR